MMSIKSMTIKAMDESGKGLAELATLSAVDNDGDTYESGAFGWKAGGEQWAMMMPAHDRRKMPFGKARVYEEGDTALAELHLNLNTEAGREWHQALLFDFATGSPIQEWSYGYNVIDMDYRVSGSSRVRVLKKLDIDEVSPVLRGAGVGTRTIAIKGAELKHVRFDGLITELGIMASAIDADPSVASASGLKQLREIHDAIGRVFGGDDAAADEQAAKAARSADSEHATFIRFQSRAHLPQG
ncbi:MAG: hypothetical protein HEQ22_03360 [Sphingopyxis sp.]|uniref:hypothetical protein n=1 Tax=Sphingopyxis sp. TaxID=1908224 RepID=UPI003D80EEE7